MSDKGTKTDLELEVEAFAKSLESRNITVDDIVKLGQIDHEILDFSSSVREAMQWDRMN